MKEDIKKKDEDLKDSPCDCGCDCDCDSIDEESKDSSPPINQEGDESVDSSSHSLITRELKECQKQRDEYLAGWQRAKADFINYKKEEMERMGEIMKYAGEEIALRIIPVLDNFELAEKNLSEEDRKDDKIKGILQIKSQIEELLKVNLVEEINTKGAKFDPNFHEAIEQVESKEESGTILEELQKGYLMNGRLLRPSKVKVAK